MYMLLVDKLHGHEAEGYDTSHTAEPQCRSRTPSVLSDHSDQLEELKTPIKRRLSISPATLAHELENNGVYEQNSLDTALLDDFLSNLAQKEYVDEVNRCDIKTFTEEVKNRIIEDLGCQLPTKINKEVLINAIQTENNCLLRIGHKVRSSDFIKVWMNYDADCSGYIELKELKLLVQDYAQLAGGDISGDNLTNAIESLMSNLDTNKDGKIELEELSKLMSVEDNFMKTFCGRQYLTRKDFNKIFTHYDVGDEGCLDKNEVMALLNDILKYLETNGKNIHTPLLHDVYEQVMKVCDSNGNGSVQKCELALLLSCF